MKVKPRQAIVLDAVQYPCEHPALKTCGCAEINKMPGCGACCAMCHKQYVETSRGQVVVNPGDWIVTGITGAHFVESDAEFTKTYEPAE